ncbi:hypothetical protein G039_0333195 [Pseudomonas aeruginosa VRFPA01]|nr:hypothetical protein G039_0333195 [Pseudomonas aeruginosa VRFPA01]
MSFAIQQAAEFYIPIPAKLKEPIRLLPSGNFVSVGGRGGRKQDFYLNDASGKALADQATAQPLPFKVSLGIDNEGDTPAAGWFKQLVWRADGLYVLDLVLAKRGVSAVVNDEYRYFSPVFYADTNIPRQLIGLLITNDPPCETATSLTA